MSHEPKYKSTAFVCPNCSAYAQQQWEFIVTKTNYGSNQFGENVHYDVYQLSSDNHSPNNKGLAFSDCQLCGGKSVWLDGSMIYPVSSCIENPRELMPDDVKEIYNEAREVYRVSPRSSAALLRLALEILLPQLGAKKSNINNMIAQLVSEKKAFLQVQKAMDVLRVIGNDALHPGIINIEKEDSKPISLALFKMLNYIIVETKESEEMVDGMYSVLPESLREKINERSVKSN